MSITIILKIMEVQEDDTEVHEEAVRSMKSFGPSYSIMILVLYL